MEKELGHSNLRSVRVAQLLSQSFELDGHDCSRPGSGSTLFPMLPWSYSRKINNTAYPTYLL